MLIVVNYHYVRPAFDAPYPSIHGITPQQLEAQLRLLGTLGEFVTGAQLRDAVQNGGENALPSCAILVTFDDGLREQIDHALPVLERLGVPAMFFVNTDPIARGRVSAAHKIHLLRAHTPPGQLWELLGRTARARGVAITFEGAGDVAAAQYRYDTLADARVKYALNFRLPYEVRDAVIGSCFRAIFGDDEEAMSGRLYMSSAQLRELGARACVGTHGHEHVPLGRLSRAAVTQSVEVSLDLLTAWIGHRPYALSYPYGSSEACGGAAGAGAGDAGIELAFTTERAGNADLANPLYLARFDCNDVPGGRHARIPPAELFACVPSASRHRSERDIREAQVASDLGNR